MKINTKRNVKVNSRQTQSIFETSEEELQQNLLRYNSEKNRINNNIENMTFKNFWVI